MRKVLLSFCVAINLLSMSATRFASAAEPPSIDDRTNTEMVRGNGFEETLRALSYNIHSFVKKPVELKVRPTFYYVTDERDYADEAKDKSVLDMKGNELLKVSENFFKSLRMEGTGKLIDGRVLNYAGKANGETRYKFIDEEWGHGVGSCHLKPFRSVAVDPAKIPLGSKIFVKETVGIVLPDGSVHDGYWYAEDVGSMINNLHVDFFVGLKGEMKRMRDAGIDEGKVSVKIISVPKPSENCALSLLTDLELADEGLEPVMANP